MATSIAQAILSRWPSRSSLAADMGVKLIVVHRWFQRGSIPAKYDARLMCAAGNRNIPLEWAELAMSRDQDGHDAAACQLSESAGAAKNPAPKIQQSVSGGEE